MFEELKAEFDARFDLLMEKLEQIDKKLDEIKKE